MYLLFNVLFPDSYLFYLLALGIITLLAATIPNIIKNKRINAPIIYLMIGMAAFYLFEKQLTFRVIDNVNIIKHISEFVIIISLTNAGLKIEKPFSWQTWKYSFWLLLITLPLTIIAAGYLGWAYLGLAPASAILFGSLIAPTDPVLASDLQTTGPSEQDISKTKLALTSEAGINDGLAFPFTFFAIYMVSKGQDYSAWFTQWFLIEVLYKITTALVLGALCGWLLYKLIFKLISRERHSQISRGILSLSLTVLPYALTEMAHGYGFIAVFIAACVFGNSEKNLRHMDNLHDFTEEIERVFVALIFIAIGIYASQNFESLADVKLVICALIIILIIRPLTGWLALLPTKLVPFERFVLSFYGIRGVGSIFYLTYALSEAEFSEAGILIKLTLITIIFSIIIHGISAAGIHRKLERYNTP